MRILVLNTDGLVFTQFVTGAAQGVDASRVVFAFARDNALPGSRWWKKINSHTQTPVNAVWLVMVCSAVCGLLGFSETALSSLAGYASPGHTTPFRALLIVFFSHAQSGGYRAVHKLCSTHFVPYHIGTRQVRSWAVQPRKMGCPCRYCRRRMGRLHLRAPALPSGRGNCAGIDE